jgi:ATP-dependent DNA helicase DinG
MEMKSAAARLASLFDTREEKGRLDRETMDALFEGPSREIGRGLTHLLEDPGLKKADDILVHGLLARAADLRQRMEQVLRPREVGWLQWYEKRQRGVRLHASPLDISESLNEMLYSRVEMVGFTSATLSTGGNFDYIRSRLGLSGLLKEGIYPSHFHFDTQTLLYIPEDLPPPNAPDFTAHIAERILEILQRTAGRALVLFTSYRNLNQVHHLLRDRIPFTLHRQGDAPRTALLEAFREDIHSVLFATGSFWQGVDVPGESLSCLIVDKLPFDSPGDPVVAARIEVIQKQGRNPFMAYQVPSAIITLKQGLGRLIRKSSDRGVLSILDNRILRSRYGRFFLESLPPIPISHDVQDITRFFASDEPS